MPLGRRRTKLSGWIHPPFLWSCGSFAYSFSLIYKNAVRGSPRTAFGKGFSYAVTDQTLKINTEKKVISLNLQIDTDICSMYEYFEIFLQRMLMCRGAADMLGATFKLTANGAKVL
jgi:hypothetical protein